LWQYAWQQADPGAHVIVSRAIDSRGNIQPEQSVFESAREDNSQWPRKITV
jgi:hypothetical protein